MLRKVLGTAAVVATCAIAADPVTAGPNAELACSVIGEDGGGRLTEYNLLPLMKEDGARYKKDAFEWNFCAYLPNTRYFA